MSTFKYLRDQKNQMIMQRRQDAEDRQRAQDMEDKQMELLNAEIDAIRRGNDGSSSTVSGGLTEEAIKEAASEANKYLNDWNNKLRKAEGYYSSAIGHVNEAGRFVDRAYDDLGELDDVGSEIKSEWDDFKTNFGDTQKKFLESGEESLDTRRDLRDRLMQMSQSDEEGAAGRAMADVANLSEQGRQAEAMRLQGLGIDPTSGRARSFMQESRDQQALNQAQAANQARLQEKDRAAGLTAAGLELIDPSQDITAASQIQELSGDLLNQRKEMATTKAELAGDLAATRASMSGVVGDIAGSYARDVAEQVGDYGATMKGISLSNPIGADIVGGSGGSGGPTHVSHGFQGPTTRFGGADSRSGGGGGMSVKISRTKMTPRLQKHFDAIKRTSDMRSSMMGVATPY